MRNEPGPLTQKSMVVRSSGTVQHLVGRNAVLNHQAPFPSDLMIRPAHPHSASELVAATICSATCRPDISMPPKIGPIRGPLYVAQTAMPQAHNLG